MAAPPRNALLSATLKSVRQFFREFLGVGSTVEAPTFCEAAPIADDILIRVSVHGAFEVPMGLSYEPKLAACIAERWAAPESHAWIDRSSCVDVALEASDVVVAAALRPLQDLGFWVKAEPPRLQVRSARSLPPIGRCVVVPVRTDIGGLTVLIGEAERAARPHAFLRDGSM